MATLRSLMTASFALIVTLTAATGNSQFLPRHDHKTVSRYKLSFAGENAKKVRDVSNFLSQKGYDVAGVNFQRKTVELILSQAEAQDFNQKFGKSVSLIRINESKKLDPRFLNPQSLEQRMRELASQFPNQAKLHSIGQSLQGRPILALELTSPTPALKPNILIDGMHHAREVMTPEIALDVAETLLQAQRSSRAPMWFRRLAGELMDKARIWVVPMVNPDGNNIVWTSYNMWRKNARASGKDVHGVDVNRNYPFQWSKCNGSSGSPSSETFRGAAPASEPETQAVIALGDLIKPVAYLSYHSYSELVLAPYGCQGQYTPEKNLINYFGQKLASYLPVDEGRGNYTYGTTWEVLYTVDGGSIDYFYAAYGSMSYVLEVNQDFQPSYDIRSATLQKHRVAWSNVLNEVVQRTQMIRVTDAQGQPVEAKIEFSDVQQKAGERAFATTKQGILFKVLAPGQHLLRATAGGRSVEVTAQIGESPSVIEISL